MNIFGFRPFKGKFSLGNSDDIPTNDDGTLIGAIKQINTHLTASNDAPFRFDYDSNTEQYGYIIDEGGADTFVPFSSGGSEKCAFIIGDGTYWPYYGVFNMKTNTVTMGRASLNAEFTVDGFIFYVYAPQYLASVTIRTAEAGLYHTSSGDKVCEGTKIDLTSAPTTGTFMVWAIKE